MTHQYELMVIFDPDTDERSVQPTLDRHLTVIVLTNRNGPEPYSLARRIAALWGATP